MAKLPSRWRVWRPTRVDCPFILMSLRRAEFAATAVGVLTILIGVGLGATPEASTRLLGLRVDVPTTNRLRAVGFVDLVVALGLLVGQPRWPWMLARATANLPTAVYFGWLARRNGSRAMLWTAIVVGAATVPDIVVGRTLGRAGR